MNFGVDVEETYFDKNFSQCLQTFPHRWTLAQYQAEKRQEKVNAKTL